MVGALLASSLPPAAGAEPPVEVLGARLPRTACCGSAVWTGTEVLLFAEQDVYAFDPAAGTVRAAGRLPVSLVWTSAVWTGDAAYVFPGGEGRWDAWVTTRTVYRFDPATGTAAAAGELASFPGASSAVWSGDAAYVFGFNRVVRFDPATSTSATLPVTLPVAAGSSAAVWTGDAAFLLGGEGHGRVTRFDPATTTATLMQGRFPKAVHSASAVWDGAHAYVFGGTGCDFGSFCFDWSTIARYSPASDSVEVMRAPLPSARRAAPAVAAGSSAYVLGGLNRSGPARTLDEIVRVRVPLTGVNTPPAPVIDAGTDPAECGLFYLDGTGSSDADGDPLSYRWFASTPYGWSLTPFTPRGTAVTRAELLPGSHTVALVLSDGKEHTTATAAVNVVDTKAPFAEFDRPSPGGIYAAGAEVGTLSVVDATAIGAFTARVEAYDACGIRRVTIDASTGHRAVDSSPPYELSIESPPAGESRQITFSAVVEDVGGHEVRPTARVVQHGTTPPHVPR